MPLMNFKSPEGLKDAGALWETRVGIDGKRFTSADQSGAPAAVADAPASGEKLVVTDLILSVDTAMRVSFYEQDQSDPLLELFMPANAPVQFTPRGKLKLSTADKTLMVQTSVAGNICVTPFCASEP